MKVLYSSIIISFIILSQINLSKSDCVMMQEVGGNPSPADEAHRKPHRGTVPLCPDYQDTMICCSDYQAQTLQNNFISLESIFGTAVGGCDICVANLKKFWCHFTCHPDQSSFLSIIGFRNHTIGKEVKTLLDLNFTLNEDMNCELFNSCKKTKFAAQVPAMSNAVGFMNFQGVNAYTKTAVYINILTDKEKGLKYDIRPCEYKPEDKKVDGIPIEDYCTCNSCAQLCDYNLSSSTPVLEGLSWTVVGCFYGFVIVATILIFVSRNYCGKNKKTEDSTEAHLS